MNFEAVNRAGEELNTFKDLQDKGIIAIDAEGDPAMDVDNVIKEESSSEDSNWVTAHHTVLAGTYPTSRSGACRRASTSQEETSERRDRRRRGAGWSRFSGSCFALHAAFWQGSQWMTSLYSCEKLSLSLECYDSGLSLRHSILSDESFISL